MRNAAIGIDAPERFEFELGGLPLRGEPLHEGHVGNIRAAKARCRTLVVLVGSSNVARDYRNPFTYDERREMITACFPMEVADGSIVIRPMPDFFRNNKGWAANTKRIVREVAKDVGQRYGFVVDDSVTALAGFRKDKATSEYLDMFPEWGDIMLKERISLIDATAIREAYFKRDSTILADYLPQPVVRFLERFRLNPAFGLIVDEREEIDHCRAVYNKDDPENFTGDILIRHRSKSLLIKRGGRYGYGLWAFPGGLRDEGEDFLDASLRELTEETGLVDLNENITIEFLKQCVKTEIYNDTKGRDLRGRYTTKLFVIVLPDDMPEPKIEPRDDAKEVHWVDHETIPQTCFFADHYGMLTEAMRLIADQHQATSTRAA